jgi:hypothetical protein
MFTLNRISLSEEGIFSVLTGEDGSSYFTAEHAYDGKPKLPNGIYICVKGQHLLHSGPVEAFEITNVPGHSGILFHIGNYPQIDSDGCVLLGKSQENSMITHSKEAFEEFMNFLKDIDSFQLVVK